MRNFRLFHLNIQAVFVAFYILLTVFLFLYSFTQIDLNLTLSQLPIVQPIQKFFQWIGYFNRPLSTSLYIGIVIFLFSSYFAVYRLVKQGVLHKRIIWIMIFSTAVFLIFSYNAFSYDLFNYIFDARIVTFYNQNPYEHKALDYLGDPMLTFMRWTHRTFPYGPTWLGLTVPLSYVGLQYFLLTLVLFKALMAISYLGTAYFINRILRIVKPEYALLGTVFFAFNPLVIVESVVSAHNDIVMMFIAIMAIYLLISRQIGRSFLLLFTSIGIKFATFLLLPVFVAVVYLQKKGRKIPWEKFFLASVILMLLGVIAATIRSDFQLQPWYLMFVIPFSALLVYRWYIVIPTVVMCFFALLIYVPFLYTGNYDQPVPAILSTIAISGVVASLFILLAIILVRRR